PIRDASRAVTGVFVACMETTATMRAQQALIESEQRFRMTSLATNDLLYEWHVESGDVQWNEALQRVLGYPSGQFGHIADWEDAVHPDDRQRVIRDLHAAIDGGAESWSNEYRFRKRDGSYAVVL